jgi:8-oxo-dGTP pyrophosphatase MutT (NUDIX family)
MADNNLTDKNYTRNNINCGCLIFCSLTKRYLFLLRSNGKQANKWGLVGGRVEPGELMMSGLLREIREELGGSIADAEYHLIEEYHNIKNNFRYNTFLTIVDEEFVPELNNEHKGYCWVKIEDYPRPLHPGVWRTFNVKSNKERIKELEELSSLNAKVS